MSQPDEFLDRVPEPRWLEPDDTCTDCDGTGLLADPVEPCIYCDGTGHVEPRRLDREKLRALDAALASLCPFCGYPHAGLCQQAMDAPLTPTNMLRVAKMLQRNAPEGALYRADGYPNRSAGTSTESVGGAKRDSNAYREDATAGRDRHFSSLTAASQAADPADRPADTHGASSSLTDESPVPAGPEE